MMHRYGGWAIGGDFLKAMLDDERIIQIMASQFLFSWFDYTVKLGTHLTDSDKEYVLFWYNNVIKRGMRVPQTLPFIFGLRTPIDYED